MMIDTTQRLQRGGADFIILCTNYQRIPGRIVSLDITGNIASAKCEIETPKALFTDYFNLIRVADRWYIMDKISTRVDK